MTANAMRPPPSRYVCKEHLTAVDWRGHGCGQCRSFYLSRRKKRGNPQPTPDEWETDR